jgi:hypothetical protein
LILFLTTGFLFFTIRSATASGEFTTDSIVTYEAKENGSTLVTHETTLTNTLANVYATGYSLTLEGYEPKDFEAWDKKGTLVTKIQKDGSSTRINLSFNDQVVGAGSQLSFSIRYKQQDVLAHKGKVWEITIPKQVDAQNAKSYLLRLVVPKSFGKAAFVSPTPVKDEEGKDTQIFLFDKKQVSFARIVAAFGQFQIFDFDLNYHLSNPEDYPVRIEVALPPNTSYQKVFFTNIIPSPYSVTGDQNGNWLATFTLKEKETITVKASGQAHIFASPQEQDILTSYDRERYLAGSSVWQTSDSKISILANSLKTPKAIYDYVVGHLTYNYKLVKPEIVRNGAIWTLENPDKALCTEFTDLFIALSRASGIPAREIQGYAYTTDPTLQPLSLLQDVLHSWPEYWNEKTSQWIQVDPTWGNTTGGVDFFTKLDLNHFAFVIHGDDPNNPYPAGSYRLEGDLGKSIDVRFGQYQSEPEIRLSADITPRRNVQIPFLWQSATISLTNNSGVSINHSYLSTSDKLMIASSPEIPIIPPYGTVTYKVSYNSPQFLPWVLPLEVTLTSDSLKTQISLRGGDIQKSQKLGVILLSLLTILSVLSIKLIVTFILGKKHEQQAKRKNT